MSYKFSKKYRLLKTEEFSSVFAYRKQRSTFFFQILYLDNSVRQYARLGLVVSKKVAKRANKRNYMKRVIRNWFRIHHDALPSCDFVVRVRHAFDREQYHRVCHELSKVMLSK